MVDEEAEVVVRTDVGDLDLGCHVSQRVGIVWASQVKGRPLDLAQGCIAV